MASGRWLQLAIWPGRKPVAASVAQWPAGGIWPASCAGAGWLAASWPIASRKWLAVNDEKLWLVASLKAAYDSQYSSAASQYSRGRNSEEVTGV